jgi:hypothetical protein
MGGKREAANGTQNPGSFLQMNGILVNQKAKKETWMYWSAGSSYCRTPPVRIGGDCFVCFCGRGASPGGAGAEHAADAALSLSWNVESDLTELSAIFKNSRNGRGEHQELRGRV